MRMVILFIMPITLLMIVVLTKIILITIILSDFTVTCRINKIENYVGGGGGYYLRCNSRPVLSGVEVSGGTGNHFSLVEILRVILSPLESPFKGAAEVTVVHQAVFWLPGVIAVK